MLLDFEGMKREYQRYEKWNPQNRLRAEYTDVIETESINRITSKLLDKSQKTRYSKFDFQ